MTAARNPCGSAAASTRAGRHTSADDLHPFVVGQRARIDLDRRREASMEQIRDLTPAERVNARARIAENSLTVAWVDKSLSQRCASYRFALEHLAVAEPQPVAAEADSVLTELQQQIAANQVVVVASPRFTAVPAAVAVAK